MSKLPTIRSPIQPSQHLANPLHFSVIVIGVGSMGAAACWFLARQGVRVLGLEQFGTPHENGSHSGQSRIIRKAYFEHPDYVPLLERAYAHWRSFQSETGMPLYEQTGVVYFGRPDNENISGIRRSAELYGIPLEECDPPLAKKRYGAFSVPDDFDVLFEPDAGFVRPGRTIELYVREAQRLGADIRTKVDVLNWAEEGGRIRVTTSQGAFTADKLIITAGAWTSRLVPQLRIPLRVTRQTLAWVSPPHPEAFSPENFPCWFVEDPARGTFYGFPLLKGEGPPVGLKLAHHFPGEACAPESLREGGGAHEVEKLRWFLRTYLPGAGEDIVATKNCLYTNSPDGHFVVDHLPGYDKRVVIACGFSGHGFKFVPVIGEVVADLAVKGKTDLPIGFLRMGRFREA